MHSSKVDVLGVAVSATDHDAAVAGILDAARARRSCAVTALAVHGVVECVRDPALAEAVNGFDLVAPDGQPVRWAMNALHRVGLPDKVPGPDLVDEVCAGAAREGIGVYLFGSTAETLRRMRESLTRRHPGLVVAGSQPDRFREATAGEDAADVARINASGAGIVLVGRGCPRQERWVAAHHGRVHAAMLGVGAAFDYHAGTLRRAPGWMQRAGLEWVHRLAQEPRRLARRYLVTNATFTWLVGRQLAARAAAVTVRR